MKFGIVGLVAVVGAYFLGIDPRLVMGLLGGGGAPAQTEEPVEAGTPTDEAGQFVAHVLGDTEDTWTAIFAEHGDQYPRRTFALFDDAINTGCGSATSAAGPFYCPADNRVYIDLAFFRQLETEFAAQGDFAKAYVIAHEVGHHVQTVTGISDKVRAAQQQCFRGRRERAAGEDGAAGGLLRRHLGASRRQRAPGRREPATSTKRSPRLPPWATTPSRNACRAT